MSASVHLVQITKSFTTVAGWQTLPLEGLNQPIVIEEVYIHCALGVTLDDIGIGRITDFSDSTKPQLCGYFNSGVVVAATDPEPGFSDIISSGGISGGGEQREQSLGIKHAAGGAVLTVTIKGRGSF